VEDAHHEQVVPSQSVVLRAGHRVPGGCSFFAGDDDGQCRVIRPDGVRCGARRMRQYGLCAGHAGLGLAADPRAAQRTAAASRSALKARRRLLGIGPGRVAPLQAARLRALERAEELAEALVDGPLDDPNLRSLDRQRAAIAAVELLFPEQTLEVQIPTTDEELDELDWFELQELASKYLQ
jgi:hypothetical protein